MVKGLREKTIELIQRKGQFNMEWWCPSACGTACCIAGNICLASGLTAKKIRTTKHFSVATVARNLWAKEYGEEEAARLGFTENEWGYNLDKVTPEQAIAHLNGEPPVWTGDEDE